ncbi:MlaD family protein [Synechococcus sp. A10-1-5-1]|uniref:MlaD family protein n=1 Tax=Synechococcus sp. A10-1-5-1 TaxID=2936507 RepID=UPI0020006B1F|nr:MlaD family protein [Synechococcus sp. A10-1-5-1]UPM49198.1 MlaD family protein [Synechococcus sp. A10-1-5-1]
MRRSVKEAIVGFTLLAAVSSAGLFWLWLKGVSVSNRTWRFQVNFSDAAGLAPRSAVTYRGVSVGHVQEVTPTATAVEVQIDIDKANLQLPQPLDARVEAASLLGGDAVVALTAPIKPLPKGTPGPKAINCNRALTVCNGSIIQGKSAATLSQVTATLQQLLDQAEKEKLIPKLSTTIGSINTTAQEATAFMKDGQGLIGELQTTVRDVKPTINNLNASTAHILNFVRALDNPKTLSELKGTVANLEDLTTTLDRVGGDIEKLTSDKRFMDGLRSVAIGLGAFFDEVYPEKTETSR